MAAARVIADSSIPWQVDRVVSSTEAMHRWWPDELDGRSLVAVEPIDTAVVLGSSTPEGFFDIDRFEAAGVKVVRRASGGGAVLIAPGAQIWLGIYLASTDVLVERDIGRSFAWLGSALAPVISSWTTQEAQVVIERQPASELARRICFGGLGFGEITVCGDKVVGLSQRRTRSIVSYQVSVLWHDRQSELLSYLKEPALDLTGLEPGSKLATIGLDEWGGDRATLVNLLIEAIVGAAD
ncbi:MAG: lipoyl protein ligase domain-containing protein [Ferrimicrobium sp.]